MKIKKIRRFVGRAVVVWLLVGCNPASQDRDGPEQRTVKNETATWIPLDVALPPEFFASARVRNAKGESGLYVEHAAIDDLVVKAKEGNGFAQQTLYAMSRLLTEESAELRQKLNAMACELAKNQQPRAVWQCSYALLRYGTTDVEFRRATEMVWPMIGMDRTHDVPYLHDRASCSLADKADELCGWNAFKGDYEKTSWGRSLLIASNASAYVDTCSYSELTLDSDEIGACEDFFASESPDDAVARYWQRAKVLAATSIFHQRTQETRIRARRLIDEIKSRDPDSFQYFDGVYNCHSNQRTKIAECLLWGVSTEDRFVRAAYKEMVATESCRSNLEWWQAVEREGLPVNVFSSNFDGLGQCLLKGDGVPQDFNLATRIGQAVLVAASTHGGAQVLAWRFGVNGYGGADFRTSYFVLSVLGHDLVPRRTLFLDPDAPHVQRDLLARRLEPSDLLNIQQRATQWRGVKIESDDERKLLAGLTFFEKLQPTFINGESQPDPKIIRQGTGFVISSEGHVVTNAHVVGSCKRMSAKDPLVDLQVLAIDPANDLALLQGDSAVGRALGLRTSRLNLGEEVTALGFPLSGMSGGQFTATSGSVSALAGPQRDSRLFQLSAPVHPGNSGGPVVDSGGRVVGVVVASADPKKILEQTGALPQNMNYAIKASILSSFLELNNVDADLGRRASWFGSAIEAARPSVLQLSCGGEPAAAANQN